MDHAAYFKQAVASEKEGKVDLAATLYQRILDELPTHPQTLYNLATLNAKRNDYRLAITLFERLIAAQADIAPAYYNVAICYMKLKNVPRAVDCLKQAVAIDPHYLDAHHLLGGILLGSGEYAAAEPHFEAVLQQDADHASAHGHLGMVQVHLKKFDDAEYHLARAMSLDSSLVEAHYHAGLVALARGKKDDAAMHFESTVARDGQHFSAYYNLALLKKQEGQLKLAQCYIEKAYAIAPNHPFVIYLRGMLNAEHAPTTAPAAFVQELFDEYAPYYERHLTETLDCDLAQQCYAMFESLQIPARTCTMDLGCGTGLCGVAFRGVTAQLIGVDLSENMLAEARDKRVYDALYQEEMVAFLRRSEATCDLVVCCDALGYIGALEDFFDALSHALTPGGYAVLTVEAGEEPYELTVNGRYAHGEHYVCTCAAQVGINVVRCEATVLRQQSGRPVQGFILGLGKSDRGR